MATLFISKCCKTLNAAHPILYIFGLGLLFWFMYHGMFGHIFEVVKCNRTRKICKQTRLRPVASIRAHIRLAHSSHTTQWLLFPLFHQLCTNGRNGDDLFALRVARSGRDKRPEIVKHPSYLHGANIETGGHSFYGTHSIWHLVVFGGQFGIVCNIGPRYGYFPVFILMFFFVFFRFCCSSAAKIFARY